MKGQPRGHSQPTAGETGEQTGAYSVEVLKRETAEMERKTGKHRAWSRIGALEVAGWSKFYFAEIAPGVRTNHRHHHRRKQPTECGPLCEARDIFAVILLGFEAAPAPTALPLLDIILPQIEPLCRVTIVNRPSFSRSVRRDLAELRKAVAADAGEPDEATRRLIRRYPEVYALIEHAAARRPAPAIKPA